MRTLPRHVVLVLAKLTGCLAWLADFRGRATAMENLRVAFNDTLSWSERARITRRAYQTFARNFFDLFWCASLSPQTWSNHFEFDIRVPHFLERMKSGGVIWITAHLGNFEMSSLVWGWEGLCITIVAQDFKNPALTDIFKRAREVSGHSLIPQQGAMLRLTKTLARGGHSAFLSDLNVRPGRLATAIECFGLKTSVTTLHVQLAQRLKLPIVSAISLPQESGRSLIRVLGMIDVPPDADPGKIAQQCWDGFEAEIRASPELWMWMYKHWRYLPGIEPDDRYPDYANPSGAFRKLLAGHQFTESK